MVKCVKEIVNQYLEENFGHYKSVITFSCPLLEVNIKSDEIEVGYIELATDNLLPQKVYFHTTHPFVQVSVYQRTDTLLKLEYRVNGRQVKCDTVYEGSIVVTTEIGEYTLEYYIERFAYGLQVQSDTLITVDDFAQYAKFHWLEAVHLFYTSRAREFFESMGEKIANAYSIASAIPNHAGNVDAFLVYLKAKEELIYSVKDTPEVIDLRTCSFRQSIDLLKNGYGNVSIYLEAKGDFIQLDTKYISDDQFLGNECTIHYEIDVHKLKRGLNEAAICLQWGTNRLSIPIRIQSEQEQLEPCGRCADNQGFVKLLKDYIAFRMKLKTKQQWFQDSLDMIDCILDDHPEHILTQLVQVQLMLTNYRRNEAKWILNHLANRVENVQVSTEEYCYYLYLTTLFMEDDNDIEIVAQQVDFLYQKHGSWWMAWLLCYMNKEYQSNPVAKLKLLKSHTEQGCASPVLYVEALQVFHTSPELFTEFNQFTCEVLHFGIKNQCIEEKLADRMEELIGSLMVYSPMTMRILSFLYERQHSLEVLYAVCRMLIREQLTGEAYFRWYVLGVDQQIRLTNIYEYYMMSMPEEEQSDIAKSAVLYFAYSNHLPYKQRTALYCYLLEHGEEYHDVLEQYKPQIDEFVREQIQIGRINSQLATLYACVLPKKKMDVELATYFANILFKEEITVKSEAIQYIVVMHPDIKGEVKYPVMNCKAQVAIYHKNAIIVAEDYYGNRLLLHEYGRRDLLLLPEEWYGAICEAGIQNPQLDWYYINQIHNAAEITLNTIGNIVRLLSNQRIKDSWKERIRSKLYSFYYEQDLIEELDELMLTTNLDSTDEEERYVMLQLMVKRGLYDRAYEIVETYGLEEHEPKSIARLCKRLMSVDMMEYDSVILSMAYYAYSKGEINRSILSYLNLHFEGTYFEIYKLYQCCVQYGEPAVELMKRYLILVMFCRLWREESDAIFQTYESIGDSREVVNAYLKYQALRYIKGERDYTGFYIEQWTQHYYNCEFSVVIGIAILKFYASKTLEYKEVEKLLIIDLLQRLLANNIFFAFFKRFIGLYEKLNAIYDYTIIEYQANVSNQVTIYYDDRQCDRTVHRYQKADGICVVGQFYVHPFLLFFGESVDYYITEVKNGEEIITQQGTITVSELKSDSRENKFNLLNHMQLSYTLQEYEQVEKRIDEYLMKEYLVTELFELM